MTIVVFLLVRLSGDPLQLLLPVEARAEDFEILRHELGLDKPLYLQYVDYISNLAHGDFGKSLRAKRPVSDLIWQRLPNSVSLAGVSMFFAMLLAMPLGVIAAVKKGSGWDTLAKIVGFLGQAMPNFWLGGMLILIFAVTFQILPTSGMGTPWHFIMPGITIGWFSVAGMLRLLRSSMLEVLDSEYVKLARSKGVSERRVIWIHALRNALIPVVTFAGFQFSIVIGAAIVVETVFTWPGIGRLAYEAVMWRDFPLMQGVMLVVAAIVILCDLVVDVTYAFIDPRIRY